MQQQHRQDHSEGMLARMIEEQTAKLPSDLFLWAALGSIGCSLFLQASNKKEESLFVGQWAPTFLILGLYNKIVKVAGSDQASTSGRWCVASFRRGQICSRRFFMLFGAEYGSESSKRVRNLRRSTCGNSPACADPRRNGYHGYTGHGGIASCVSSGEAIG